MSLTVAIDGPAGSGKSTVSKEIARRNGLGYFDTGAMYRAAAWWALHEGIDLEDQDAVATATRSMPLDVGLDPDDQRVRCGGEDISAAIRTADLSAQVSKVATNLAVREILRTMQRDIIASQSRPESYSGGRGIVAEGRDITTVVSPDADVRVLLTASEEARLRRRALELSGADDDAAIAATRHIVSDRDRADSTVSSFMTASDGVVEIDSSALTVDEVVSAVETLMGEHRG